jgi:hypothetical protein
MESPNTQRWFLRKHEDGSVFGPLSFVQVESWAANAQIAPHDSLSLDRIAWMKAPMVPQLAMDWLVEVTSERYYGPTTLGAIREFVRLGDLDGDTHIINACDGTRLQIQSIPELLEPAPELFDEGPGDTGDATAAPHASRLEIEMRDRIRDLEQTLSEERRALKEVELRYRALEERYNELARQLG